MPKRRSTSDRGGYINYPEIQNLLEPLRKKVGDLEQELQEEKPETGEGGEGPTGAPGAPGSDGEGTCFSARLDDDLGSEVEMPIL